MPRSQEVDLKNVPLGSRGTIEGIISDINGFYMSKPDHEKITSDLCYSSIIRNDNFCYIKFLMDIGKTSDEELIHFLNFVKNLPYSDNGDDDYADDTGDSLDVYFPQIPFFFSKCNLRGKVSQYFEEKKQGQTIETGLDFDLRIRGRFLKKLHYDLLVENWLYFANRDAFSYLGEAYKEELINDRLIDFQEKGMKMREIAYFLSDKNCFIFDNGDLKQQKVNNSPIWYVFGRETNQNLISYFGSFDQNETYQTQHFSHKIIQKNVQKTQSKRKNSKLITEKLQVELRKFLDDPSPVQIIWDDGLLGFRIKALSA